MGFFFSEEARVWPDSPWWQLPQCAMVASGWSKRGPRFRLESDVRSRRPSAAASEPQAPWLVGRPDGLRRPARRDSGPKGNIRVFYWAGLW